MLLYHRAKNGTSTLTFVEAEANLDKTPANLLIRVQYIILESIKKKRWLMKDGISLGNRDLMLQR